MIILSGLLSDEKNASDFSKHITTNYYKTDLLQKMFVQTKLKDKHQANNYYELGIYAYKLPYISYEMYELKIINNDMILKNETYVVEKLLYPFVNNEKALKEILQTRSASIYSDGNGYGEKWDTNPISSLFLGLTLRPILDRDYGNQSEPWQPYRTTPDIPHDLHQRFVIQILDKVDKEYYKREFNIFSDDDNKFISEHYQNIITFSNNPHKNYGDISQYMSDNNFADRYYQNGKNWIQVFIGFLGYTVPNSQSNLAGGIQFISNFRVESFMSNYLRLVQAKDPKFSLKH